MASKATMVGVGLLMVIVVAELVWFAIDKMSGFSPTAAETTFVFTLLAAGAILVVKRKPVKGFG